MPKDDINKKLLDLLKQADSKVGKLLLSYEGLLKENYRTALIEVKNRIAAMFEKYGNDVKYSDMVSYNRLTNLEREIADQIRTLTSENIKTTRAGLKEFYSENYYRTAYSFEQSTGLKLGFGLLNPTVITASLLNPLDRITWSERMVDNAQTFIKQIKSELTQGLIQGEGYSKIARTITDKTGIDFTKSVRIIRTEGHRVQNAARVVSFKKGETAAERLGLESVRVWIHSGNPREPRPDHLKMDGVEAGEDGKFTLPDGVTAEAPGLTGKPEHDINCGCTVALKFNSLNSISMRDYVAKHYDSFDDWQTEKNI